MSSPKVFHLISSLRRGGRERQLATIYKYTDPGKISTKIVCFNHSADNYISEYRMEQDVIYLRSANFFKRFIELTKIVKSEKPGIIWTWGGLEATMGILLAFTTRARHINGSIRHGIISARPDHVWRLIMLHLSKNIVANSHAGLKANFLKRGMVLYNGLDEAFFQQSPGKPDETTFPEFKPAGNKNLVFISVANLVPYKDYYTVLKALALLKTKGIKFQYLVAGEGPDREAVTLDIEKKGLKKEVVLLGRRKDINQLLSASDIFIHSSRGEGCSNAIIEAMAAGLPVIASDTGGTLEIVNEDFGLLFKYGDASHLLECIEYMVANPEKLAAMKVNAKNYAIKSFHIDTMMDNYLSILKNVMK
jgi:glycosyltransferase involved in cell wall biosynthesis